MTRSGVLLPSPFQDPVAIRNPSPPEAARRAARTERLERGAPTPGFPGSSGGRARECAPGEEEVVAHTGGQLGAQPTVPPLAETSRRAKDTLHAAIAVVAASRVSVASATRSRPSPSPAVQLGVTLTLPAVWPSVLPATVRRSQERRREDERGVSVVGTGSQRGEGKDSGEEPRRRRPLPPLMLPIPRGWRCRRGRVLGIVAPGAQRSPLARRLSSGTQRAGAAKLGWSPASGCMLIRWGGGVPRFLRPTTEARRRAAAAPGASRFHPPQLLRHRH